MDDPALGRVPRAAGEEMIAVAIAKHPVAKHPRGIREHPVGIAKHPGRIA